MATFPGTPGALSTKTSAVGDDLILLQDSEAGGVGKTIKVSELMVDTLLEISKGTVTGHSTVNKFGRNPDIAASSTETIWDGSALYPFPTVAAGATIVSIWQAADVTNNRSAVLDIQGLDVNWDLVDFPATLDGTDSSTEVTLGTALRRVFRVSAREDIETQNVHVGTSGKAATNALVLVGENQTQMAVYTVPNGKTAYMTKYYASVNEVAARSIDGIVKMYVTDNSTSPYPTRIKHTLGLDQDATSVFEHSFAPYFEIAGKSDIYLDFQNAVNAQADVSAGFDLILVDD